MSATMTLPPLAAIALEPTGTRTSPAFVHRAEGCGGLEMVTWPTYTQPHPGDGTRLYEARRAAGMSLRAGSVLLGLRPVELSGIEREASHCLAPADVEEALRRYRGTP